MPGILFKINKALFSYQERGFGFFEMIAYHFCPVTALPDVIRQYGLLKAERLVN